MAYDINKWVANDIHRRRNRWLPWYLGFGLLITVAFSLVEVFDPAADDRRLGNFSAIVLVLMLGAGLSPFARSTWMTNTGLAAFDELERDALMRATQRAYAVMIGLLAVLFCWFWLASLNGWPMPRTAADWSSIGISLLAIGAALPIFFAEILVPIPPEGDEEEE